MGEEMSCDDELLLVVDGGEDSFKRIITFTKFKPEESLSKRG